MVKQPPTYSIIMIVHNDLKTVQKATLKTLQRIASYDARLVVVDNASNDGSERWLDALALRGDIDLLRNKTDIGDKSAIEQARRQIDSPYFVQIDSDANPTSTDWLLQRPSSREEEGGKGIFPIGVKPSIREVFSQAQTESPRLTVVIGIRAMPEVPQRLRNVKAALWTLNFQDLPRWYYRIVLVEQDQTPRHKTLLAPLVDDYVFAPNGGPYNRSWSLNIGASRAQGTTDLLCLTDADMLAPPNWLRRCIAMYEQGHRAFFPFTEIVWLDELTTNRAIEDRLNAPMEPFNSSKYPCHFCSGGLLCVDTTLYHEIGGFDERFWGWGEEDLEFITRLRRVTNLRALPGRLLHLYHTPASRRYLSRNRLLRKKLSSAATQKVAPPIADRKHAQGTDTEVVPTPNEVVVAFCVDSVYARYLPVALCSLYENNAGPIRCFVLHATLSNDEKKKVSDLATRYHRSIEFVVVNHSLVSDFKLNHPYLRHSTFYRCLIPEMLGAAHPKVLYLDVDTIVDGELSPLFDLDLPNKTLGAVHDYYVNTQQKPYLRSLGIEGGRYFNSGALLFNCAKWLEEDETRRILDFAKSYSHRFGFADQCLLNRIFAHKWQPLSPKYNSQESAWRYYINKQPVSFLPPLANIEACWKPVILHFTGQPKPWHMHYWNHTFYWPWSARYLHYARKTEIADLHVDLSPGKRDFLKREFYKAWRASRQ